MFCCDIFAALVCAVEFSQEVRWSGKVRKRMGVGFLEVGLVR